MGGKSRDPYKGQRRAIQRMIDEINSTPMPEYEKELEKAKLVGLLEAEGIPKSELEQIQLDPSLKDKQMKTLAGLEERSEEGLTATDKMAMEDMLGQVAAQEKAQRASIESEMQRRGTADSGASLMAKLQGSQGGAQSARQKAMQMAAQGQQQRMAALQSMGQMAGQMENADFGRQSQVASAADRIAQANAMNRQNVSAANLASRQGISNTNTNIANMGTQMRNQLAQQDYMNRMNRISQAGQLQSQMAAMQPQKGPSGFQQLATVGGGIAGAVYGGPAGAAAGAQAGSAVGGMFEDGGIARSQAQEYKAHEKFKSNYMKRVREELAPQKKAREEVTGVVHAENGALAQPKYDEMGVMDFKNMSLPQLLQKGNAETEGVTTDNTINDIGDYNVESKNRELLGNIAKERMLKGIPVEESKENSIDPKKFTGYAQAIGGIAQALNPTRDEPSRQVPNVALKGPENSLKSFGPVSIDNPMASFKQPLRLEDGGLPEYGCGGIHKGTKKAEDGEIMFDSNGDGAVVGGDSFERDRVDARLNSGEAVLNVAQQQRLMDLLRGEADIDDLGDEDIVEGVPMDYQQELTDEIDNGKDKKMEGLKKLLSALGE
jgi:hypothetical protein